MQQLPLFQHDPQTPEEIHRQTPFNATFKLFGEFLTRSGKSEHTLKAFLADLGLVAENLGGETPIGEFATEDLRHFLTWMETGRGIPCSRKTYARRVTTLKVYFRWLYGLKAIPHDPARAILQRSGPAPLSDALSNAQINDCIAAARTLLIKKTRQQDYRPEMLFRLLVDTGLKKNEVMKLKPADIDRANPHRPQLIARHKTRNVYRERLIELDPDWVTLLDLYLEQYELTDTIINCTARNLEYILTDIGTTANIPFSVSFEVLRWTCAVRDYQRGMEEQAIREKLGLSVPSWSETSQKIKQLSQKLA